MHFLLSKISCKLLISLPDSLKLDHGICDNVKSIVMTSRAELHDLEHGHYEKTKVITANADRSLGDDYKVSNISLLGIYIYMHIYIVVCFSNIEICVLWARWMKQLVQHREGDRSTFRTANRSGSW